MPRQSSPSGVIKPMFVFESVQAVHSSSSSRWKVCGIARALVMTILNQAAFARPCRGLRALPTAAGASYAATARRALLLLWPPLSASRAPATHAYVRAPLAHPASSENRFVLCCCMLPLPPWLCCDTARDGAAAPTG